MPEVGNLVADGATGDGETHKLKSGLALIFAGDRKIKTSLVVGLVKLNDPKLVTAADVLTDQRN